MFMMISVVMAATSDHKW